MHVSVTYMGEVKGKCRYLNTFKSAKAAAGMRHGARYTCESPLTVEPLTSHLMRFGSKDSLVLPVVDPAADVARCWYSATQH